MSARASARSEPAQATLASPTREPAPAAQDAVGELAAGLAPSLLGEAVSGPGRPLSAPLRAAFEERFGLDLGDVRVHEGPVAANASTLAGARAIATGPEIVLGAGEQSESTADGRRLLAHEVAHVAQWRRSTTTHDGWSQPGDGSERLADAAADGEQGAATAVPAGGVAAASKQPTSQRDLAKARAIVMHRLGVWRNYDEPRFLEFAGKNEAAMIALLGPYGYRGCWAKSEAYLADFDKAQQAWLKKEGFGQFGPVADLTADPEELAYREREREREQNQLVMGALPDGTGYMGTRRDYDAAVESWHIRRTLQTGENIAGGLFGAIGYGLGGDEGSDLGSSFDGLMMAAGSTAEARNQMRDVGAAARPMRDEQAEVRPARPAAPRQAEPPASARPPVVEPAPAPPAAPAARSEVEPIPIATPTSTSTKANAPKAQPTPAPATPVKPPTARPTRAASPSRGGSASKASRPGAPNLAPYPGWKAEWDKLAEQAMEPTPRAADNGFAFRSASSKDGKIRVTVTEGVVTKAFTQDPERGPALPGEQSAHSIARNLGEETGPSTQGSAPRASNLSQDKTAENFLRQAADTAAEQGATIEVRTTLVTELRTVNGEEIPVQIAKRRQAFLRMPGSDVSREFMRYETAADPGTRAVSEKSPPPRHVKSKIDKSEWIKK